MSDLEELIEMRKEAIEKAIKYYNTIKEKLKENAKEFYKNYINPELERQAKTNINSAGMVYLMNGRYILSDLTINRNSPVKKWLSSIINDNIPLITICELLNIAEDPIIAIDISEKAEDDRNYLYFKISNIKDFLISCFSYFHALIIVNKYLLFSSLSNFLFTQSNILLFPVPHLPINAILYGGSLLCILFTISSTILL